MVTLHGVFKDRKEQPVDSQGGKEGEEEKWDGEVGKFQAARTGSINELRGERADFIQEQEVDGYDFIQEQEVDAYDWVAGHTGSKQARRPNHKGPCDPN